MHRVYAMWAHGRYSLTGIKARSSYRSWRLLDVDAVRLVAWCSRAILALHRHPWPLGAVMFGSRVRITVWVQGSNRPKTGCGRTAYALPPKFLRGVTTFDVE